MKRLSQIDFLNRSRQKHGDYYDYSEAVYQGLSKRVKIICRIHGSFFQRAGDHFRYGCKLCGIEKSRDAKRLDTKIVIEKSRETHGDRYDYSLTNYVDSETKIVIICKIHGPFEQIPGSHYGNGCGCPKCGDESTRQHQSHSNNDFIRIANTVHNFEYDYSKSNYVSSHKKVEIICKVHGSFFQTPASHKFGSKCPKCSWENNAKKSRIGLEEFVNRANKIHGGKYQYHLSEYKSKDTPLIITCKNHGNFLQSPANHTKGKQGCPKCGLEKMILSSRISETDFIEEASKIHNNEYDYSDMKYIDTRIPVKIKHINCGEVFFQSPGAHKAGQGCPSCGRVKASLARRISFQDFVKRSNELHSQQYTYFLDSYSTTRSKTEILCNQCEETFLQSPNKHMAGQGCPNCNQGGFNPLGDTPTYYVMIITNGENDIVYYKGGVTNNLERREYELKKDLPKSLDISLLESVGFNSGYDLVDFERLLLSVEQIRAPKRSFDGGSELFISNPLDFARENNLTELYEII